MRSQRGWGVREAKADGGVPVTRRRSIKDVTGSRGNHKVEWSYRSRLMGAQAKAEWRSQELGMEAKK